MVNNGNEFSRLHVLAWPAIFFPTRHEGITSAKVENEERDASAGTRLVEPRSSPVDRTNTGPIFARVGSHDGVEKDAAAAGFFFSFLFFPPFPFTPLEQRQMQLWMNGSLKVPLRLFEGLQAGRQLQRAEPAGLVGLKSRDCNRVAGGVNRRTCSHRCVSWPAHVT